MNAAKCKKYEEKMHKASWRGNRTCARHYKRKLSKGQKRLRIIKYREKAAEQASRGRGRIWTGVRGRPRYVKKMEYGMESNAGCLAAKWDKFATAPWENLST